MLTFKSFLREQYLIEATAKHFNHIDLDASNPEHKDLIDAYNRGHSANDHNVPRHPGQIRSIDQLKSAVHPHLQKIQQKHKEDIDDIKARTNGEANVVHHNPDTGATVTQVTNQAGSCAAGASSSWCTGRRGVDMVHHYDPEGHKSFVFKFPKEKKKHLRTIGAYGAYNGDTSDTANHQDAENHTVHPQEWHRLVKEHGLDKIKHLKGSVRDIPITSDEKSKYAEELTHHIKMSTTKPEDLLHASANRYLTKAHKQALATNSKTHTNILNALASDPETHKAILKHPNAGDNALDAVASNTNDPEIHKAILKHPKAGDGALADVARNTRDLEIHKAILKHPKAGDNALATVAYNTTEEIHKAILKHPNAGDHVLSSVARNTTDPDIHKAILKHPNAGDNALSSVARNTTEDIHKAIVKHPNAGDNALSSVASHTQDPDIHKAILKHPNAGDGALSSVAYNTRDPEIHKAILKHPKAGDNALATVAYNTRDPEIHKAILKHPKSDSYPIEHSINNIHDAGVHHLMINKYKNIDNEKVDTLADKYKLPKTSGHNSKYDQASDDTIDKLQHGLSKLVGRSDSAKSRTEKLGNDDPIKPITPIKNRQRRYNFHEQILEILSKPISRQ